MNIIYKPELDYQFLVIPGRHTQHIFYFPNKNKKITSLCLQSAYYKYEQLAKFANLPKCQLCLNKLKNFQDNIIMNGFTNLIDLRRAPPKNPEYHTYDY